MAKSRRSSESKKHKSKSNKSDRKSRRSSKSKSSKRSSKSRSSKRSQKPNVEYASMKSEPKKVYEPNCEPQDEIPVIAQDADMGRRAMVWMQGIIVAFCVSAMLYQVTLGKDFSWVFIAVIMFFEFLGCALLFHRMSTGFCCVNLGWQYISFFFTFSLFLRSTITYDKSVFGLLFSFEATAIVSACLHFIMTIQSIETIASSKSRKDYSNMIIVESTQKRRRDVFKLVTTLLTDVCDNDADLNMNLTVKDETGRTMKLAGAGVEAGINRVVEMKVGENEVEMSTNSTAAASINIPKKGGKAVEQIIPLSQSVFNSAYNNCQKQEKMLSPRKIL